MKLPVSEINLTDVVLAQHELALLFEYYPQEVSFRKDRLITFRKLLDALASEPQYPRVSQILNGIISQHLNTPLYERWDDIVTGVRQVMAMLDAVCTGEIYRHNLLKLIEFCNFFYKQFDREFHHMKFDAEIIPA